MPKRGPKPFLPVGVRNRIEGFIDAEEGDRLAFHAASVPSGMAVVELGSASGSGALFLAAGIRQGGAAGVRLHCFDPYEDGPDDHRAAKQYRDPLALDLLNARARYVGVDKLIDVHKMRSLEGAERWARKSFGDQPIGLLHVDALHDYDNATADVKAWAHMVAPGGVLIMHDLYGRRAGEVERAVNEYVMPSGEWQEIGRYQWSRSTRRRGQFIARRKG